jgi:hypothetical protein
MMVGQLADSMANPEHLKKLQQGLEIWNPWRKRHPEIVPDLSGAVIEGDIWDSAQAKANLGKRQFPGGLSQANLDDADLSRANLNGVRLFSARLSLADFRDAHLEWSDLRWASMTGANLSGANLDGANLFATVLDSANLTHVDLREASLFGTKLDMSDLSNADIGATAFNDIDFRTVKGLETVQHHGPSGVGVWAIYRSEGNIPEDFLRGCGVPDDFITYAKSLVANPIQFYSCFISYSTKDQDFADRLYADLQSKGVRCWFAPHDIQSGRKLHEQIDEAIRLHDKLLLILSPHSYGERVGEDGNRQGPQARGARPAPCPVPHPPSALRNPARLGMLRRRHRQRLRPRDSRVLHPRLQQLEKPRLLSGSHLIGDLKASDSKPK